MENSSDMLAAVCNLLPAATGKSTLAPKFETFLMATEIERKFLVRSHDWKTGKGTRLAQGYLSREAGCTVRVRMAEDHAYLTIKGRPQGISRLEFEYEIPVAEAEQLLKLCDGLVVEKTRFEVTYAGVMWEVDEFHGANAGLVVAEVELETEEQAFERPPWLGDEVTSDFRYANSALAKHPYSKWGPEAL
jgi:CYTH domain-containing protein